MNEINIYCDESNHLLLEPKGNRSNLMILGAISVPKDKREEVSKRIKEFKKEHALSPFYEMKWTKVSPSKIEFYLDIIDYFFDSADLSFRAVIIDKGTLDHTSYNQTHDEWYYKMYFFLLRGVLSQTSAHHIYIDIKDTKGNLKVVKLGSVLANSKYDFNRDIVKKVQQIRSEESEILQIVDILIGAIQHVPIVKSSSAKERVISRIKERSHYSLEKSTLPTEKKINLFYWRGRHNGD